MYRCYRALVTRGRTLATRRFLSDSLELGLGLGLGFPKPSLPGIEPSPGADALAALLLRHHNPFHPLESPLELVALGGGAALSPALVVQTLLRLRHASKVALAFFVSVRDHVHHHRCNGGAQPLLGPAAYDAMVDILGRVRQFDVAWQLIVEMGCGGGGDVGPTPRTFAVLVRRYVAAGMTRQAIRSFDDMEAFVGREPSSAEFQMLLDTLCKYGHAKVATEIFNKRKSKYEPDEKTYSILIYGWCKVNQLEMAQKHASLHPENRFDRTIRAAEDLLKEMGSRGIEPDVTSYSIILHVYSRAHKPELCLHMFRSMREKGICPTVATYTSVVKCLASCGRLEAADKLLDEMSSNGVCPSPATYNCFFKEYRGRNDAEGAMNLYKKMKESGLLSKPDIHTYNILLGMFSKLDRLGTVRELWSDMSESGVGPDLDSYTLLIHGLCEKNKWREACQFFMEMIEKGFLPQKVTFETLYRGLIQADMLRTWRRLKKKVDEESLKFGAEFEHYHFKPYKR
ncbi:Pentatricopeptide repeat-containing protein, mitochondrial [Ananas comosus]|uniref:Pentatricopeptide repeat-containing protein, mitochondrial n=1 Tax=Ananas comosus TaxID=4615 RepID=A0A199VF88_ANACO|nr:Pentatricopeptide repeat-containing protein, mitochondrial [Ananas comosus]